MIGQDILFSIECGHWPCDWSDQIHCTLDLFRFIACHPCNMSADWSPFSSQLNWFIFMQTCNNHPSMPCQLIGQCCLSVLSNWSIFLQTFLQSPIHALSADWSALPLKVTGPLFCRVQSPMDAIYHLIGQLCLSKLSDWLIFLQMWCSQQNMQYMIWLFRFALF